MADLDALIQQGNALRGTELGSPRFEMWANDVRAAVKPYGDSMMEILESALQVGVISWGGPSYNDEQIDDAIEFLEGLKERTPEDSRAQDMVIKQKQADAHATLNSKFHNITVRGDATFGDGSPITKVTVNEFMSSLIKEVEQMPESEDKHRILDGLKAIISNPTFAAVSGTVVGELLKKFMLGSSS